MQYCGPADRRLAFEPLEDRHLLATITVNTLIDVNANDGLTTLREAISAAVSGDTINFSVTGTISLANVSPGHLLINKNLAIQGPGASLLTVKAFDPDANGNNDGDGRRVFLIDNGNNSSFVTVAISGLTLTNGDPQDSENTGGGAILNRENLTITASIITGNHAANGGGIYSRFGTLTISDSTISGNIGEDGGGVLLESGTANITRATFENNYAGNEGGAVFKRTGNLSITDSTLSGNGADLYGGGISKYSGGMTITGSTISGNSSNERGGGIYNRDGSITIAHSTITGNRVSSSGHSGGGITSGATVSLIHTIVAGNLRGSTTRDDISASTESAGSGSFNAQFSLIGDRRSTSVTNQGGSLIGTSALPINPLLGPLADNGGPTETHALLAGSPAVDAGNVNAVAGAGGVPLFDQRGASFSRVADGDGAGGDRIDIGAFEVPTPPPPGPALPGDYNRNNVVDAADYVLWRKTLGSSVPRYADADGDGDEMVDEGDYGVWTANFGNEAPSSGGGGESSASTAPTEERGAVWFENTTTAPPLTRSSTWQETVTAPSESPQQLLMALESADEESLEEGDAATQPASRATAASIDEGFSAYGETVEIVWDVL